jgi:4-diphosphocytidyl-2C-methyl-D-erythritol kinase
MGFLSFIALLVIIWLLWGQSRNTTDALDKQTALQHQMVALEKRIEALVNELGEQKAKSKTTSGSGSTSQKKTSSQAKPKAASTAKKSDSSG